MLYNNYKLISTNYVNVNSLMVVQQDRKYVGIRYGCHWHPHAYTWKVFVAKSLRFCDTMIIFVQKFNTCVYLNKFVSEI
jgi:hypothetical protein